MIGTQSKENAMVELDRAVDLTGQALQTGLGAKLTDAGWEWLRVWWRDGVTHAGEKRLDILSSDEAMAEVTGLVKLLGAIPEWLDCTMNLLDQDQAGTEALVLVDTAMSCRAILTRLCTGLQAAPE